MYFESRMNSIIKVDMASKIIQQLDNLSIGQALQFENYLFVNDENPSGTGAKEIAILLNIKDDFYPVESLTWSWMTPEQKITLTKENFIKSLTPYSSKPISFNSPDKEEYFICGCCGTFFQSTMREQKVFDQDAGYGICAKCS